MFPTQHKDKISRSITYPLKAKAISEALAEVPQADELKLWFSNGHTPAELRQKTEFRLIEISYSHHEIDQFTSHQMEQAGHNDPKWRITVTAIPIEIRARATQLLHEDALPKLATWLHSKGDVSNFRHCRIEVFYNEADDKLEYSQRET